MHDLKRRLLSVFPWQKRAAEDRAARQEEEKRRDEVISQWSDILLHKRRIDREIALNDWTATAVRIFSGKDPEEVIPPEILSSTETKK